MLTYTFSNYLVTFFSRLLHRNTFLSAGLGSRDPYAPSDDTLTPEDITSE